MTQVLKHNPKSESCSLLTFCSDKRMSGMKQDAMKISFSRQTAAKLNDVVCARFGIIEETDRKLFESIYYGKEYDCYTLQDQNPNVIYRISICGDKNAILKEDNPEFRLRLTGLNRSVLTKKYNTQGILRIAQHKIYSIDEIENSDYSVVSLFNSHSFKRLTEYSTDLARGRMLEILEESKL